MTTMLSSADVYTDFGGLTELKGRARDNSEESLREVAQQFEALYIQMMLKSMRDASLGDGVFDSEQTETYQAMYDQQIALDMSKGKGIGLAEVLVRQLRGPVSPEDPSATATTTETVHSLPTTRVRSTPDWKPQSANEFVQELWPHAETAAKAIGVEPETLISQAALETGWGQHMIRGTDGRNSFNLFGIKAGQGWTGERVTTETVEFRDGLMRKERAHFRAYSSVSESFQDYTTFLQSNSRYRDALDVDAKSAGFVQAMVDAGYATDPDYASKINRIQQGDRLQNAIGNMR